MIAISYRQEDSLPTAGRLYDRLQAKFGKKNIFMDFDSIPPGADFREQTKQMIDSFAPEHSAVRPARPSRSHQTNCGNKTATQSFLP